METVSVKSTDGSDAKSPNNNNNNNSGSRPRQSNFRGERMRRSGGGMAPPATASLLPVQPQEGGVDASRAAQEGVVANGNTNANTSAAVNAVNDSTTSMKRAAEDESRRGDEKRRRRQWWWWRQQQQQRRRLRRSRSQSERRVPDGKPAPAPHRSALRMNPNVRCVGSDGLPYNRTFKDLLRCRVAGPAEADTPCLAASAAPHCVRQSAAETMLPAPENEEEVYARDSEGGEWATATARVAKAANSPPLKFTFDGVATPKTFAMMKRQEQDLIVPPLLPPARLAEEEESEARGIMSPTSLRLPAPVVPMRELPHQKILRDYAHGCFSYYQREETKKEFLQLYREILEQARPILEAEPLFPRIVAPTFVFGDIHGNFEDLSFFLRNVLIFHDLQLTPANLLCLGDYVDRGPYSLECLMLLLSLKISYPSKVVMLRGNHEDRVVCGDVLTYGSTSFLAQCEKVYGSEEGRQLFKEVTTLFWHFPLAAELVIPFVPNSNNNNNNAGGGVNTKVNNSNIKSPHELNPGLTPSRLLTAQGRRRTHEERVLCTHGGIPRFFAPPKNDDSLAFLRRDDFPRMLTLFPNNPSVRCDPEAHVELLEATAQTNAPRTSSSSSSRAVSEEVLRKAWYIAFDLMWSDPTSSDPGDDDDDNNNNNNNSNNNIDSSASSRRGNAHVSINEWGFGLSTRGSNVLTFSSKAVDTFLQAHQYSMLFRAHQEKAHGLRLSKSSRVLTIFSSSNYLGHGNGAGCVLVTADGEIQLVEKISA